MSWLRDQITKAIGDQKAHYKRVEHALADILNEQRHIKELIMADQDTINQIAADISAVKDEVNTVVTELGNVAAAGTNIEAELAKLLAAQGAGQPLDFSALQSAVGDLKTSSDTAKASADNLVTLLPDPGPQSGGTSSNAAKAQ